ISFACLDLFPGSALNRRGHRSLDAAWRPVSEYVGMASHQLVADRRGHRIEVEMTSLLCDSRMEDHLKQKITEFVPEMRHVAPLDGIGDFVGLLDGVGGDARKCLYAVPRAAVHAAQPLHDREKIEQPGCHGDPLT